jgi:DNA-binding response OmpR family regulator
LAGLKKKLLIADDDAGILTALHETLEENYLIYSASDGAEALGLAQKVMPDLIILDMMMPKMDGLEACSRIKAGSKTSAIPVLLLTGKNQMEDTQKGFESGADAYMVKPFLPEILLKKIRELIEKAEMMRGL